MHRSLYSQAKRVLQNRSISRAAGSVVAGLFLPAASFANYSYVNITDSFTGPFNNGLSDPVINNSGTVAFLGQTFISPSQQYLGLYTTPSSGGGPITTIVNDNSGAYTNLSDDPALNDNGQVAFTASTSSGTTGVFIGNGHTITPVYQSSTTGPFLGFYDTIFHPAINNGGTVAFLANYNYGYNGIDANNGIFAGAGGSSYLDIYDGSQGGPGDSGSPAMNKNGEVVFASSTGISEGSGAGFAQVLVSTASGKYTNFDNLAAINDSGQVAFAAQLTATNDSGMFVDTNGTIDQIADGNANNTSGFTSLAYPVINNSGEVAFGAYLYNAADGYGVPGIYTGSDPVADKVIAAGDTLFGSTVQSVSDFIGLNNAGQIAFAYELTDGDEGIAVANPVTSTLTWTNAGASNPSDGKTWDFTNNNWNNGTGQAVYTDNSNVIFNDNSNGHYSVTLNTTVSPASIVVNNSLGNYTISGTGTIAGNGSLTKLGTGTLTLSTFATYTGGTTVSAGLLKIAPTSVASSTRSALPSGVLIINGAGEVQLAPNVTKGSQSADPPISAATSNVNIAALSISGAGVLDITNNHIIIDYGEEFSPIYSIAALIKSGYNGGLWNGPGINSSTAAANSASYGIGYADSADPSNPAGLSFGQIEIMYTLLGDANLDGKVNGADFTVLAANFNQSVANGWDEGDFNYDGPVNGSDFTLLANNFNQSATQSSVAADDLAALDSFAAANGIDLTSVPEPTSAAATMILASALVRRRLRHQKY